MAEKRRDGTKRDKKRKENNHEEEEESMKENIPGLDNTYDEAVAGTSSKPEDKNGVDSKEKFTKHIGKRKRKEWRRGKLFQNALRDKANIEARARKTRQFLEELDKFEKENESEYDSEEEQTAPKDRSLFNVEYYVSKEFQQEKENYIQQQSDSFINSDVQSENYIEHVIDKPQRDTGDNNQQQLDSIIDMSNIKIENKSLEEDKQFSDPVIEPLTCDNVQTKAGQSNVKILPKFRIRSQNNIHNRTSSSKKLYEEKCVNIENSKLENIHEKYNVRASMTYRPKNPYTKYGHILCRDIECNDMSMKCFLCRFATSTLEKLHCLITTNNEIMKSFNSLTCNNQLFYFGNFAVWNMKEIFAKVSSDIIEELKDYYVSKVKTYNARNFLLNIMLLVDQSIPFFSIHDMIMVLIIIIRGNALNKYPPLKALLKYVLLLNENSQQILRYEVLRIQAKVNNSTNFNIQQKVIFNDHLLIYSQIPKRVFLFPTVLGPLNTDFTKTEPVNNYFPYIETGNGNTRSNTTTNFNKNIGQSNAPLLYITETPDTITISCNTNTTHVAQSTSTQDFSIPSNVSRNDEKPNFGSSVEASQANRESIAVLSLLELSQCYPQAQSFINNQEASQPKERALYPENENNPEPEVTTKNSASTISLNESNQNNKLSLNDSIKVESETHIDLQLPSNNSDVDDQSVNPSQGEFQSGQELNDQQNLQRINVDLERTNYLNSQSTSNAFTYREVPPHLQTPLHIQIPSYSQIVPRTQPRPPRQIYLDPRIYPNPIRQHPQTSSQMFQYPPRSSQFFTYPNTQLPPNFPMFLPQHPQVPFPYQLVPYPQTYSQLPSNFLPRHPGHLLHYPALPPRLEPDGQRNVEMMPQNFPDTEHNENQN